MFRLGNFFFVRTGIARNSYGYAADGMPLAFTREDFLVTYGQPHSYTGSEVAEGDFFSEKLDLIVDMVTDDTPLWMRKHLRVKTIRPVTCTQKPF